jgi:cytochrome d ubiquinol oxidase subunit II
VTLADAVLAVMWVGLSAYVLFGGADFGAGFWDLLAGSREGGRRQRDFIEHSIAPVWEANHVWLIFVLVVLWTAFPPAFAAIASTLYIPLTLAALGMIARGSAFAFRKTIPGAPLQRFFGASFALSSMVTPFFLGAIVGGVASGRVPPGIAAGDELTSWLNPTSVLGGLMSVGSCAYLAAVYLCADAIRDGETELAEQFRTRALACGTVVGGVALIGVWVLYSDAPDLFDGLTHRGLPLMVLSGAGGAAAMMFLGQRRYLLSRAAAGTAVTAVVWGWALAQYPYLLQPELTIEAAAAPESTLRAMAVCLVAGSALLIPSLVYMFWVFQRKVPHRLEPADGVPVSGPLPPSPHA